MCSLDDIVEFANASLAAAGDARRFYALATDGDWHAYLALAPSAPGGSPGASDGSAAAKRLDR